MLTVDEQIPLGPTALNNMFPIVCNIAQTAAGEMQIMFVQIRNTLPESGGLARSAGAVPKEPIVNLALWNHPSQRFRLRLNRAGLRT